jgi:hypothetical protein
MYVGAIVQAMSTARRRGLVRLAILVFLVGWLIVLAVQGVFRSGSHRHSASAGSAVASSPPRRLRADVAPTRLPQALHGATVAPVGDGLLVIGGADRSDVSTNSVYALDASSRTISSDGTLIQPLHDAASATVAGRTLVFGGGGSTAFDAVQELNRGSTARQVGRIPLALSDLSAIELDGAAYVVGGYDGRVASGGVLQTADGRRITTVARLPAPVRYTALAAIGGKIYAFGGELGTGADTDLIQEYDLTSGRTKVAGHLPEPTSHASAVTLDGAAYLLGGRTSGSASDQILRFDPARNAFAAAGRLPRAVFDAAAGTAGDVAYLFGGIDARGASTDSILVVRP